MARLSPFINKLRILSVDLNDAGEVLDCAKEVLEGHELQTVFVALTDQERQEKRAGEARRRSAPEQSRWRNQDCTSQQRLSSAATCRP